MSSSNPKKVLRIKTDVNNPSEKFINLKLNQDFEKIEVLSLTLRQTDVYRTFNSNYGCLIGRVQSNGTGLPNCKVSVFIPISTEDEENPEILSIYPFKSPNDVDNNGKRYNLLNKLKRLNPFSGFKQNNYGVGYRPKTPIGTIPDKSELLCNETWVEVYEKYYKFSTITNQSGDYMLFGVPVGVQQVHMDCDITDIGKFSTSIPVLSKVIGLPSTLFNDDGTKLVQTDDLTTIPTLQTQNQTINVVPFWGDSDFNQIGITRLDFNVNAKIVPVTTIAGAGFTQAEESYWGDRIVFRALAGLKNLCINIGKNCNPTANQQASGGVFFNIGLKVRLKLFGKTVINEDFGNTSNGCDPDSGKSFVLCFCLIIIIRNIIPFFRVKALSFAECTLNGGEFEQEPFSFKWLGPVGVCGDPSDAPSNLDDFTTLLNLDSCRTGQINQRIFYYKPNVSDTQIENFLTDINSDIAELLSNQYAKVQSDNGTFLLQIPCNRTRVITDEFGNEIITDEPNLGLPTEFYGYAIFTMDDLPIKSSGGKVIVDRVKIKVPQCTDYDENVWVKTAYKFESNNVYSVSQFINVTTVNDTNNPDNMTRRTGLFLDVNTLGQNDDDLYGDDLEMQHNAEYSLFSGAKISRVFQNNWLNGCLVFYQVAHKRRRGKRRKDKACPKMLGNNDGIRTRPSNKPLGAGVTDNYYILNGDSYSTNFIKINKDNLTDFIIPNPRRGFVFNNDPTQTYMNTNNNLIKYYYKGLYPNSNSINNFIKKDVV